MGRKNSTNVEDKRKPVKVRPIPRKHAGKVQAPYKIMEELIKSHHPALEPAKILLLWRKGLKPDVDKVLVLGRMKKASDLDRAIGSAFGDSYDFAMQLNEDAWDGLSDTAKRHVIDHELCHAAPDLDRDGQQKMDTKERLCWRVRKHPIQEFPEIVERYGIEECLKLNETAREAVEDANQPLLAAAEGKEKEGDQGGASWQALDFEALQFKGSKVTTRQVKALNDSKLSNLGDLADLMDRATTWWHRDVKGIAKETACHVEDALGMIRGKANVPDDKASQGNGQSDPFASDPALKVVG